MPLTPVLIVAVLLGLLLGYGTVRYGSVRNDLDVLNGKVLLVDSSTKPFGIIAPTESREVEFVFSNISAEPVRILGGEAACGCLLVYDDFPVTINPGERTSVKVSVRPLEPGDYEGQVVLYTSAPGSRTLRLRVIGKLEAPLVAGD